MNAPHPANPPFTFLVAIKLAENCLNARDRPARLHLHLRPAEFPYFRLGEIRDFFREYVTPDLGQQGWLSIRARDAPSMLFSSLDRLKPVNPELPFGTALDWFLGGDALDRPDKAVELTFHVGNLPKKLASGTSPEQLLEGILARYLDVLEGALRDSFGETGAGAGARDLCRLGREVEAAGFVEDVFRGIGRANSAPFRVVKTYSKVSGVVKTVKLEATCTVGEFLAKHHPELAANDTEGFEDLRVTASGVPVDFSFDVFEIADRLGFAGLQADLVISQRE